MPFIKLDIETHTRSEMLDITHRVAHVLDEAGLTDGTVTVYVPHTTAGITINENADPDVPHDILAHLDRAVPWTQPFYKHNEDNSAAHVKASMMGSSVRVFVEGGRMMLGRWQGVFLCEFDGPRRREVWVRLEA
ncbi:MAG: secondary thiamine-phosphate synthase enzyme YjbQ [Planctomycetota bacterium]